MRLHESVSKYTVTDNSDHITYLTCNLGCELQLCQDGCCDASNCLACYPSTTHRNFDAVLDAITKYDNEHNHSTYTVIDVDEYAIVFTDSLGCELVMCLSGGCKLDNCVGCNHSDIHNDIDNLAHAIGVYVLGDNYTRVTKLNSSSTTVHANVRHGKV